MKRTIRSSLICATLLMGFQQNFAQVVANAQMTRKDTAPKVNEQKKLKEVLNELKDHYNVDILFFDRYVDEYSVPVSSIRWDMSIEKNLENILKTTHLEFKKTKKGGFVISPKKVAKSQEDKSFFSQGSAVAGLSALESDVNSAATAPTQEMLVAAMVSGLVKDEKGDPLPGVNILEKGTSNGTTTDAAGKFTITVKDGAILYFSFIGYTTQEIVVGAESVINVSMVLDVKALSEVVVIGYGSINASEVTSAISSVKGKEMKDLPVAGIDQAMQGRIPGVFITSNSGQPGGGVSMRVRGITSINSNDPLVVIDGVIFPSNTKSNTGYDGLGGSAGQTANSVLSTINPSDIESIDVLKDASAQAIYGSMAANGVIIITTKKGKVGEGKINYDFYYGTQQVTKKLDIMNLQQFAQYQNDVAPLVGRTPAPEFKDPSVLGRGTDWQDAIFRTGQIKNHQLSFSGGKDKTNYYLSMNYFDQAGILIGSDFKRYTTRFNLDHQLKKWIKIGVSTNITRSNQNVTLADAAEGTIWWSTIQSPLIPVKNLDGTWGGGNTISGYTYGQDNPVATAMNRGNKSTNTQMFGQAYAELFFPKGFSMRNELAYSLGYTSNTAYQYSANVGPRTLQSKLIDNRSDSYYYAIRNYFNYNNTFGKHTVSATLGHDAQYSYYENISGTKPDLQNNILALDAGGTDKQTWELGGGASNWAMESYYGRANYSFNQRYFLSVSYRADGSSYFGPNKKWGHFPGASLAWNVTNEAFASGLKNYVNNLKLRLGYGSVGNQNPPSGFQNPPYAGTVQFWGGPVGFGPSNLVQGVPNPGLSWESVVTKNIGLDMEFLGGKLGVVVDFYKKTTNNMLLFGKGPKFIGVGDQWNEIKAPIKNVGQMSNTGIDLGINSTNITSGDFVWRTNLVFSKFTNKLEKLVDQDVGLAGRVYYDNYTISYTRPGYAVGSFFGLKTDGLYRTPQDLASSLPQFGYPVDTQHTWLGDVRFKDVNNDKKIDANDLTFIGSPLPKFTYGLNNTFAYKGIDLAVFLQGSYGAKIFNFLRWQLEKMDNPFYNQLNSVSNRYTESNPNGTLPRFTNTNINNVYISDRYIEDGSYCRIQNVTLGYKFPKTLIQKAHISNLRFYCSIQNLYTFRKYSGYDPEVGAFNNNIMLMNVDTGHYPVPRTVTFGVNLEL